MRLRILFSTAFAISGIAATLLHGQQSDEVKEKPAEIRKASAATSPSSEESPTPKKKSAKKKTSPSPSPTPKKAKAKAKPSETPDPDSDESPSPTPKKKKSASAKAKPSETPDASDEETKKPEKSPTPKAKSGKKKTGSKKKETPSAKSKAKKKPTPEEDETPASKRSSPKPSETPSAKPAASAAVAAPTPTALPEPRSTSLSAPLVEEPEQLTIEKSGYEKPRGFWERVFGGGGGRRTSSSGAGYRYLTRNVRAEIDRAPADRRNPRWQMIVVHNSGTRQGNAKVFDYYHKHVRHMQNGLAYHFVIGNGTSTGNGQVEVGDRWRRQINGGHVHSDYLNNISLGICLVGDFNRDQPTR
ncbi:MAG: peptidoglycan recognition family protein, partial [Spartobacteria bacterium]